MATNAPADDFVTIVPVGENRSASHDEGHREPAFVTVLTVDAAAGASEVVIRRPRGARLGLGLKFEGGSAAVEKVRRLLVQSCAENSPAANAVTPWGKLIPGDEILAIDGISVSELTRIDCVRRLKDSHETLKLLVRHFETNNGFDENSSDEVDTTISTIKKVSDIRPTTLPPPVPPRKLGKKNSFKDKPTLQTVGEQNNEDRFISQSNVEKDSILNNLTVTLNNKLSRKSSFDSHLHRQNKESIATLKRGSPEEVRRLVRRLSDGKTMPPEAEIYIDLLSTEWERCLALADAESDDTGSSISTVVDRLSSMASSVENSIPSTPIMQQKTIDIQKVLNCIENIESDFLKSMTTVKITEPQIKAKVETKLFENGSKQVDNIQNSKTDEVVVSAKKDCSNDNNNNDLRRKSVTCITFDSAEEKSVNEVSKTLEIENSELLEKPKPMPRNTKLERSVSEKKAKANTTKEPLGNALPEPLLTPTKKNCIENWLQRSEAEMINEVEKLDDPTVPEALPRLIDFVPKPQYKECEMPTPVTRPTTAPPPPPPPLLIECREDGSGASLDTIGELDESNEMVDIQKDNPPGKDAKERKSSYESGFWEDRALKSDAEDKSLSNDESPLPSCPRQPPDGVETPSEIVEKTHELLSSTRFPPRLPSGWSGSRPRLSYALRSQDARSEASVKDKIAMFSNDQTAATESLDKCDSAKIIKNNGLPYKNNNYSEANYLSKRLTKSQDNLDEMPPTYKINDGRPEVLGALLNTSSVQYYNKYDKTNCSAKTESKPLFYGSAATLPSHYEAPFKQTIYHARSSSDESSIDLHRSNLEYLIEQRKKSMSKLRGLVIPETQQGPIVDLPVIKVQEPVKPFTNWSQTNIQQKQQKPSSNKGFKLTDKKWKAELFSNNLPKYSPAFKRKSLQVYSPTSLSKESTPERKFSNNGDQIIKSNGIVPAKPIRKSLDSKLISNVTTPSLSARCVYTNHSKVNSRSILGDAHHYNNVEIKICTATDIVDSDNDSAMSSTQSSYRSSASSPLHNLDSIESDSSRLSPRICNLTSYSLIKNDIPAKSSAIEKSCEEYNKRTVSRSLSSDTNISLSSSAGTSGSQASCSSLESSVADTDKKKVVKTYCVDTLNRRNILASAKCRSGRDEKLSSPIMDTKFIHDSEERSLSPQPKTSERLSTLTSCVSAISNKGDNRRRNKVVSDTDSDSDGELNLRQRKPDFKNTRPKKNASNAKYKTSETNTNLSKQEDTPKSISERMIEEIKKSSINNQFKTPIIKNGSDIQKTNIIENHYKDEITTNKTTNNYYNAPKEDNIHEIHNTVALKKPPVKETHENLKVIKLNRGQGSGVGLILAGGTDCEAKDVTVHRVLGDSIADKAGIRKGAKIRSINGIAMSGLTHSESVAILKEQRSEIIIEIEEDVGITDKQSVLRNSNSAVKQSDANQTTEANGSVVTVVLEKAGGGAGLGFGLDGGKDSPHGDKPLTIKKLFAGGAAASSGRILVGAELLSAGGLMMEGYTRTQAWAALKALPAGPVTLLLRNP